MIKLLPGELVRVNIDKNISPENLTLAPIELGCLRLYEEINIDSFPGWNDFKGYNKLFKNETLIVIGKKGRPFSFNKRETWSIYDVYFLLYANKVYECFAYCVEKINVAKP